MFLLADIEIDDKKNQKRKIKYTPVLSKSRTYEGGNIHVLIFYTHIYNIYRMYKCVQGKLGIHAFNVFNCSRLEIQHKLVKTKENLLAQATKIQSSFK